MGTGQVPEYRPDAGKVFTGKLQRLDRVLIGGGIALLGNGIDFCPVGFQSLLERLFEILAVNLVETRQT